MCVQVFTLEISRNGKNGPTIRKLFIQIKPNENLCARKWSISCTVKPTCGKLTHVFFDRLIVNLSIVSKNFLFDLSAIKCVSKHINSFDEWNFDSQTENCSCANIRFQMRIAVFLFSRLSAIYLTVFRVLFFQFNENRSSIDLEHRCRRVRFVWYLMLLAVYYLCSNNGNI